MDHYVDFSKGQVVKVHNSQLMTWENIVRGNQRKRYRLCVHESPESALHGMFICMAKGEYVRPHKHINSPEMHTIIKGKKAVVLFRDDGSIMDAFAVGRDEGYLAYNINGDIYHMEIMLSDFVIDYEVRLGPHNQEINIFPVWAPKNDEKEKIDLYCEKIIKDIKDIL